MNLLFLVLLSISVYAGEKGNGGDVVICKDQTGAVATVELYDFVEARIRDNRTIEMGDEDLPVMEKVQTVIGRIRAFDKPRAELMTKWSKEFMKEADFLSGIELMDVPDTGDGVIPVGCELKQHVVQLDKIDPFRNKRYVVNADLWAKLSNTHKAGTILHELFLRVGIYNQHLDSRKARYVNSFFADPAISDLTWSQYADLMVRGRMSPVGVPYGVGFSLESNTQIEDIPGKGVLLKSVRRYDSAERDLVLQTNDGDWKVKVQTFNHYQFVYENGVIPVVRTLEPRKFLESSGWSLSFIGDVFILPPPSYEILGSLDYDYFLSHPNFMPEGCTIDMAQTPKLPTGFSKLVGLPETVYRPTQLIIPEIDCSTKHLKTDLFIYEEELRIKFSDSNKANVSYLALNLPKQSIIVLDVNLDMNENGFVVKNMRTRYGDEVLIGADGKKYKTNQSLITIDSQGLLTSCLTPKGKNCSVVK